MNECYLKEIFGDLRIVALAGARNEGKTNNLVALLLNFRKYNKKTPIFIYGLDRNSMLFLKEKVENIEEITSLEQLANKKDALIIIDEFQKLRLNDRRYKDLLDCVVDLIYHPESNNKLLLSSPNLREFNSIIGGKIERWVLKSLKYSDLVNGCQLKQVVTSYKGSFKRINDLIIPKNTILIINNDFEKTIQLDYIIEADSKKSIQDILNPDCQENVKENVKENNV